MSEMAAIVSVSLIDDITKPGRQAHKSLSDLIKDMQKFAKMSFKSSGLGKEINKIAREAKQATAAAKELRNSLSRPASSSGFARSEAALKRVSREAQQATSAVQRLQNRMRNMGSGGFGGGPGDRGGGGDGGGNGRGGRGGRGAAGGGSGHRGGWGGHGLGFGSALAHVGTYEVIHRGIEATAEMVKSGFEQAFDLEHTKAMLAIQGESKSSVSDVVAKARGMAKSLPQFTMAQHAAAIAELRPAMVGGINEAIKLAPDFQRAVGVLEAVRTQKGHEGLAGTDSHGEALDFARALELKGVTADGETAIKSYMDSMVKAIVAFNGQITAGDFHAAIKYGRGSSRGWHQDFVQNYLPTIMNDIKSKGGTATGAGNALASFSRTVVDRVMKGSAVEEWDRLGLVKKGYLERGDKGASVKQGGIEGWEMAVANPYEWFQTYFMPAMKKKNHGQDPKDAQIISELGSLFGNRIAQMLATIMAVQKKQIEKDAQNVKDAMGVNGLEMLYDLDPTTRMQVLGAAFKDLYESIAQLATPGIMRGMKGLGDWAHTQTDWIRNSAGAKSFGDDFEAFMAGFFKQNDKAFKGEQLTYQQRGLTMADSLGTLIDEIKNQLGFKGGSDPLGLDAIAADFRALAGDIHALGEAARFVTNALSGAQAWLQKNAPGLFDNKSTSGDGTVVKTGPKLTGLRAAGLDANRQAVAARRAASVQGLGYPVRVGANSPFGDLSGAKAALTQSFAPISQAASNAIPTFAAAGQGAMTALAGGLQAGSGQATSAMSTLMATLASLALAGITVPVRLDTAAAEAKLSGLMSRAGGLGAGRAGQFSPALSDIGH